MCNALLTKNCIAPWRMVLFYPNGSIAPCCGAPEGDFGNIFDDYFAPRKRAEPRDIFANHAYTLLRRQLLAGNIQSACRNCSAVSGDDIPPEQLRRRVIAHLRDSGISVSQDDDLDKLYAFTECLTNITDKCNFRCVYCFVHSNDKKGSGQNSYCELDENYFEDFVGFLVDKGLRSLTFCGVGELTVYPSWQKLCSRLFDTYPQLQIKLVSNFGRKFDNSDLDVLARFGSIQISCDTLDPALYAWLRRGGCLSTVLDNIQNLRKHIKDNCLSHPMLVFNITENNMVWQSLSDIGRYAAANDMFVNVSNLTVVKGSHADITKCISKISEIPIDQSPFVWEILYDLPRRMKSENPKTDVWDFGPLYNEIKRKAESITLNKFVPSSDEPLYNCFYQSYPKHSNCYLRKIYLSFDRCLRGIFIKAGTSVCMSLSESYRLRYRITWCMQRPDGNMEIVVGNCMEAIIGRDVEIATSHFNLQFSHVLFEVMSWECLGPDILAAKMSLVIDTPPAANDQDRVFIWDTCTLSEANASLHTLVESQEPIMVWGTGARASSLFSNTCLSNANIKSLIDKDTKKHGAMFHGFFISSPHSVIDFKGKIIIANATFPYEVEKDIKKMGFDNELYIM